MIEVTDEMRNAVINYKYRHCTAADDDELIKHIIELHESNKPKPEPVGYAYIVGNQLQKLSDTKLNASFVPLYTTPPTREPLSEGEIEKLVPWQGDSKDPFFNRMEFARAIEKAHRIGTPQTTT